MEKVDYLMGSCAGVSGREARTLPREDAKYCPYSTASKKCEHAGDSRVIEIGLGIQERLIEVYLCTLQKIK